MNMIFSYLRQNKKVNLYNAWHVLVGLTTQEATSGIVIRTSWDSSLSLDSYDSNLQLPKYKSNFACIN